MTWRQWPCHAPPQDEWDRATSAQIHANQDYLDTLIAMNALAEDPAKLRAVREQMNPFGGVSHYEFSDIQVEGNHATAKVVMTVGGEQRPSVQKLVNLNGKWYIHSSESDTLSEADAREFKETADVTSEYAKAVVIDGSREETRDRGRRRCRRSTCGSISIFRTR